MKRIVSREACHDGKRLPHGRGSDRRSRNPNPSRDRERLPFVETPIGAMGK